MSTKYRYNGELFDSLRDVSEHIQEEMNNNYEPYQIGDQEFYAGDILANMDPIAFHGDFVSPFAEEEEWELIADDVNGLAYQVRRTEIVLEKDFPKEYKQYLGIIAEYEDIGDIERANEIEHLTDGAITWADGGVWRVTI